MCPSAEFADVLEQFESQFYQQALQKFQASDFTAAGFVDANLPVQQFTAIQTDEASHQTALEVRYSKESGPPFYARLTTNVFIVCDSVSR